jgi:hypothetical protein
MLVLRAARFYGLPRCPQQPTGDSQPQGARTKNEEGRGINNARK